jgi:glycosyltransferase involved in cell wall biosynthesis
MPAVVIPSPVDFTGRCRNREFIDKIVSECNFMQSDINIIYPARLDRGKQPHYIIEIASQMVRNGYKPSVLIIDFHSTDGDKVKYREDIINMAESAGVNLHFTSQLIPDYAYSIPHESVSKIMSWGDVFVNPSISETDSLVTIEAAWQRMALILNFDLPRFREFDFYADFGKFGSVIDVNTGEMGYTNVDYKDRSSYMNMIAGKIMGTIESNPVLALRIKIRKERSLEGAWKPLWAAINL